MYIFGFIYLIISNNYILKFGDIFKENDFWLFVGLYIFSVLVMFTHAILFGNWIVIFISTMIEPKDTDKNIFFSRRDKNLIKNKYLMRFRNYINRD